MENTRREEILVSIFLHLPRATGLYILCFWNFDKNIRIALDCWRNPSRNFSPPLPQSKSNPWKVFDYRVLAAECRSCRLINDRGNGILKARRPVYNDAKTAVRSQQMLAGRAGTDTGKKAVRKFRGFDKSRWTVLSWVRVIVPIVVLPCPRTNCEIYSLPPRTYRARASSKRRCRVSRIDERLERSNDTRAPSCSFFSSSSSSSSSSLRVLA